MVLSSESPANFSGAATSSALSRPSDPTRSGYVLPEGQSPDESLFGRMIQEYLLCGCICPIRPKGTDEKLTPIEESFLEEMRTELDAPFDPENADHEMLLNSVWRNTFPGEREPEAIDPRWRRLGFQSSNPRTDIRTGVHALLAIEFMSRRYTSEFQTIVREASSPESEYPFAASCVSLAFSLIVFFKLNKRTAVNPSGSPSGSRLAVKQFVRNCMKYKDSFNELFSNVAIRTHREWMKQEPGNFDIHYYAIASAQGIKAVANLFGKKRVRSSSDFSQILI